MSVSIGYARVSTEEQNLALQLAALRKAGCAEVFEDKASGSRASREGLSCAIARCKRGDVLVVWKLDRLGRSLRDLANLIETLTERGICLKVLAGHGAMIDTQLSEGRLLLGILSAIAEFERELIRERTKAGLRAARLRGSALGRPRKLSRKQINRAKQKIESGKHTRGSVASQLGVHVTTLRRALAEDAEAA
jgi:DNA invertase Pin-like site-specific DNA recombinase